MSKEKNDRTYIARCVDCGGTVGLLSASEGLSFRDALVVAKWVANGRDLATVNEEERTAVWESLLPLVCTCGAAHIAPHNCAYCGDPIFKNEVLREYSIENSGLAFCYLHPDCHEVVDGEENCFDFESWMTFDRPDSEEAQADALIMARQAQIDAGQLDMFAEATHAK